MIGAVAGLLVSAKSWPWAKIWSVGKWIALAIGVWLLGRYLYDLGVRDERGAWEKRVSDLQASAEEIGDEAAQKFGHDRQAIDSAHRAARAELENHAHENDLAFLRAWARADRGLRNATRAGGD